MDSISTLIVIAIIAWALQIGFTFFQIRAFNHMLQAMAVKGTVKMGKTTSRWKARTIVVLVESEDKRIVDAKVFKGWTVFARPKVLPNVIGERYPFSQHVTLGFDNGIQEALEVAFSK
ncbi:transcriptional regulator GutM [Vibrio sp. VB16]|uniref:transcriptional regulator GutM n=1 Tax=Vibrio sp. VB16 TaxID=2785746 RepID=UPI00189F1790|nr:transcriptional regulator GutM [Vibrio sp. VB16]UGA54044.1 transcriptional regulator GutM [Vibrio sp. VB16]